MAAKHVTDATFVRDVLQADTPVLVDFWAEWCAPCRKVEPLLEEIANEMGDKVRIVKLNIDENPETARAYRVMSVPTPTGVKGGEPGHWGGGARPPGPGCRPPRRGGGGGGGSGCSRWPAPAPRVTWSSSSRPRSDPAVCGDA